MKNSFDKIGLISTSAKTSILQAGNEILVTGLNKIRKSDLIHVTMQLPQTEVVQVHTIGGTTPTIVAETDYIIQIEEVGRRVQGEMSTARKVRVKSATTLSGNAATDRQNVYNALTAKINADSTMPVTASAGTGGTGMTLTDKSGYYKNGKKGAVRVVLLKNSAGTGFISSTHLVKTTSARYAYGVGADLALKAPQYDPITGNILDSQMLYGGSELENAASGQLYAGFYFTSLVKGNSKTFADGDLYFMKRQVLYVDNGAGTVTTNAAGYAAFVKEFERLAYSFYENNPASIIEFFDESPTFASVLGYGDPTGTGGDLNIMRTQKNNFRYHVKGTQTILAPVWGATGLNISQDLTDNDGVEYVPELASISPKEHVVGTGEASFRVRFKLTDVSGTDDCAFGLRKKEASQANIDDYDEMAVLNVISGDIKIETILNAAATTTTDTTLNWADTETHELEIRVLQDGSVKFLVDDVDVTSVQSTEFSFDDGEVLVPFGFLLHTADASESILLNKWIFIPGIERRNHLID